ncbi:MAG: apolipoprotein N-acyltransferase [Chitinophagaceae bacterium]
MKKFQPVLFSLLSGLLMYAAWPVNDITPAVFIAFIPLFMLEQQKHTGLRFFWLIYLALFTWNISCTWWIWNSTMLGAWLAIIVNSLLMCIPWMGFRYMKKQFGTFIGYASFILFWLSFEYIHLQDWGLSWPWLTLGNVFAGRPALVQWYEYTGTSGGSLWILLVNVLLYLSFVKDKSINELQSIAKKADSKLLIALVLVIAVPLSLSLIINKTVTVPKATSNTSNIVVVQPNIDPYEKVATGTFEMQLQKLIRLSESKVDSNTTLLIWPETALYSPNGFEETRLKENFFLIPLFDFLKKHPKLHLFTGIESYRLFNEKVSLYARSIDGTGTFYESYNGSVLLDSSGALNFYHKSMLVPGVETLPRFLLFLGPVFEKFGGTTGGYARQTDRTPVSSHNGYVIAPAICYESIYGEYMNRFVNNGANLIGIITNDGWWGNTPGHQQHQQYARLRAIETRCWVARSANTGISCFIDPAGNVYDPQPWWTEAAIKKSIPAEKQKTFFVRFGDIISKIVLILAAGFVLLSIVRRFSPNRIR